MTGDRQGDWPERQAPRHSGRHSRVPREHNGLDPQAAPGQYGPPDPYAEADQYAPPDPYAYGQPDPYAAPDAYAAPDRYAAPGPYPPADGYAAPDPYAGPDGYAAPGSYTPADPYTPAGTHSPTDAYALTDRYAVPGPGAPADPHPQAYGQPGHPAQDPFGPVPDRRDSGPAATGPHGRGARPAATGPHRRDARPAPTGPQQQNGYGPPDSYDQPPFRWQPPPDATGPQGRAGEPGHASGAAAGPPPGSRDWDQGPGPDWDTGQEPSGFASPPRAREDTAPQPQPPPGSPPGRPRTRQQAGTPEHRDGPTSAAGLIPGFWDSPGSGRGRDRRPGRRMGWVLAPLLALAVLCALAVGGYDLYKGFQSKDFTGTGFGHVTVQVLPGDTATSLAPRLVKLGVVASVNSFISAAKHSANPEGLQPGFFSLHEHMNSAMAYQMLLNPASRMQTKVTIPEGLRMSQTLATLEQKYARTIPASAFAAAAKDTAALGLPAYANGNPEGYLFPATYDFSPDTSALGMLQVMVARFDQEATSIGLPAAAQADHLTPAQVITVASLLQAEAGNSKYFRQVAEVIYNRLNDGMKLGLQSTVNFALHKSDIHLTASQLKVNSPYNTYIHTGLPPGPIDSPGDAAIEAALHPDHGNLLYFVTVNLKTGLTKFTSSATQFQQFVAECQQNNAC